MKETLGCATIPHPAPAFAEKEAFWNLGIWLFEIQPGAIHIKKSSIQCDGFKIAIENISKRAVHIGVQGTL